MGRFKFSYFTDEDVSCRYLLKTYKADSSVRGMRIARQLSSARSPAASGCLVHAALPAPSALATQWQSTASVPLSAAQPQVQVRTQCSLKRCHLQGFTVRVSDVLCTTGASVPTRGLRSLRGIFYAYQNGGQCHAEWRFEGKTFSFYQVPLRSQAMTTCTFQKEVGAYEMFPRRERQAVAEVNVRLTYLRGNLKSQIKEAVLVDMCPTGFRLIFSEEETFDLRPQALPSNPGGSTSMLPLDTDSFSGFAETNSRHSGSCRIVIQAINTYLQGNTRQLGRLLEFWLWGCEPQQRSLRNPVDTHWQGPSRSLLSNPSPFEVINRINGLQAASLRSSGQEPPDQVSSCPVGFSPAASSCSSPLKFTSLRFLDNIGLSPEAEPWLFRTTEYDAPVRGLCGQAQRFPGKLRHLLTAASGKLLKDNPIHTQVWLFVCLFVSLCF